MKFDPVKWNRNAALMYAVGVWTTIGYAYYKYTIGDIKVEKKVVEEENNPNVKTHETKRIQTTIIYKEDSVPHTTMLSNFYKSTYGSYPESQKQDEDK
ncbi:small integral membrane protein 26-like [Garra rufa]|uniref:small integral membrane protein 26-like n=1 Tax=Garra rufa TaxID=137080 RepID=UPI003CCE9ABE